MDQGAFGWLDSALSAGAMFDWITPTIAFGGELLGFTVAYGAYVDGGFSAYEIQDVLAAGGVKSSCWQILGEFLCWECPRDQARYAEMLMDRAGVGWWGGTAIGEPGTRYGAVFTGRTNRA